MKKHLSLAALGLCLAVGLTACSSGISATASATVSTKSTSSASVSAEGAASTVTITALDANAEKPSWNCRLTPSALPF